MGARAHVYFLGAMWYYAYGSSFNKDLDIHYGYIRVRMHAQSYNTQLHMYKQSQRSSISPGR